MEQSNRRAKSVASWLVLSGVGAVSGLLLGGMVIGSEFATGPARYGSYSELAGNPDATTVDVQLAEPCYNCASGYGVAERLSAARYERSDSHFRTLGAVEVDDVAPAELHDDYRYGGRFPDSYEDLQGVKPPPLPVGAGANDSGAAHVTVHKIGKSKQIVIHRTDYVPAPEQTSSTEEISTQQ